MSSKDAKLIRGQVRNVVKEVFPEIFTKESQDTMLKQLAPMVEAGMSAIREQITQRLDMQQENTAAIENKLLQAASDHLNAMNFRMLAWQNLVSEKLEQACIVSGPEFQKELEERTKAIAESMTSSAAQVPASSELLAKDATNA